MPRISPLAQAIREALDALGRPASADEVKAKVCELHPELAKDVGQPRFSASVRQNRRRKFSPGAAPAKPARGGKPARASKLGVFERLELADKFFVMCGANAGHAHEVLAFLERVRVEDLRAALDSWARLMHTAGGLEKARAILETMREGGLE